MSATIPYEDAQFMPTVGLVWLAQDTTRHNDPLFSKIIATVQVIDCSKMKDIHSGSKVTNKVHKQQGPG